MAGNSTAITVLSSIRPRHRINGIDSVGSWLTFIECFTLYSCDGFIQAFQKAMLVRLDVRCGDVRFDSTMCSAILSRMVLMGSMRVLGCPPGASGATGAAAGAAGLRGGRSRRGFLRGGGHLRDVRFQILFGDASAGARAAHLAEIDVVLAGHLAHQRGERARGFSRRRLHRQRRRRRRGGLGWARGNRGRSRRGRRLGYRSGSGGRGLDGGRAVLDARDDGIDPHRLAFFHQHLGQSAGSWARGSRYPPCRWKSRIAVRRVLPFAGLLQPLGQRAFDNALAHLGHHYVGHDELSLSAARTGASYSISQSKTRPKCTARFRETSSSVARTPSCAMEVTGLVSPHGTMY